ncbi:hypothetical protein [Desulfogranum marinum]|uniref:hypothetical protein n=1 Tax=Desulfogranum marinum TaxID=453220 RepID=UPI001966112E|nr:hypothetical protein [Desulfogranum marinum]MBM9514999.1 hypothetical protein [Desulfogranum marinum]
MIHLQQSNQSVETTRKKALQIMQKGMVSYCLASKGWDVSDHFGDGYDLLCIKKQNEPIVVQVELKGIDISSYSESISSFSQSISANEIATASHLVVSIYDHITPLGHYIMTLSQLFEKIKAKGTAKYSKYKDFQQYRQTATEVAFKKATRKKGQDNLPSRMSIDIGCGFKKYQEGGYELEEYKGCWSNLEKENI